MDMLRAVLAMALLLLAIVPVLGCGARLIVAFMAGQHIMRALGLTVLAVAALLVGAMAALWLTNVGQRVGAGLALAAIPWAVQACARWWERRQALIPPSQQA